MFSLLRSQASFSTLVLRCLILYPLACPSEGENRVFLQRLNPRVQGARSPPISPLNFPQHLPSQPPMTGHRKEPPASLLHLQGGLGFALSPRETLQHGGGQQGVIVHLVTLVGRKENGDTSCLTRRGPCQAWGMVLGCTLQLTPSSVLTRLLRPSIFSMQGKSTLCCKKGLLFPVT